MGTNSNARGESPPPLAELWETLAYEDEMGKARRPDSLHPLIRYADRADRAAEEILIGQVGQLWANGWQPREVHRQVRRLTTARSAALIDLAIHADHARRAGVHRAHQRTPARDGPNTGAS